MPPRSIHGSPRVKTLLKSAGSGAPPSVKVRPPSVEKAKPESPDGVCGVQGTPKGAPQKPWASLKPTMMDWASDVEATVVSLRPSRPSGKACLASFERMFSPTRGAAFGTSWTCSTCGRRTEIADRNALYIQVGTVVLCEG